MSDCGCTPTTPITSPCKYSGADLPCVGIISGESIDSAIGKLSESICNVMPNLPETVFYTERALGLGTISASLASISGTSYTVPLGGDGEYEVTYIGEYEAEIVGTMILKLFKGLTEYSTIVRRTLLVAADTITPFTLFSSNIPLVAGDTIVIKGLATATTFPKNAICKITRIS